MASSYQVVKGILKALRESGMARVTEIGHDGMWEIELVESESGAVLGSLPPPSHLPHLPPSQTLPPSAPSGSPTSTPSYVASPCTQPAREGRGGKSPSPSSLNPTRSGGSGRLFRGAKNMELFSSEEQFSSRVLQEFMAVWNGTFVLPKIVSMKGREKLLHLAMQDEIFSERWREGIKKVAESRFCRGHNRQGTGQRPWKATVDWFLQPHVLPRVLEGKYDNDQEPEITADDQKFTQEQL